MWVQFPLKECD
uniref:Uncharacterized protein n=1 Tax=Anguilla anguilla TaxID=7936 RepID=A0A0E9VF76_ANGAN